MRYRRRKNEFWINAMKIRRGPKASISDVSECRSVRRFIGLTQEEAAQGLSVSYYTLRNWETGHHKMPQKALKEYRRYLRSFYDKDPFISPPEDLSPCERIRWEMTRHKIKYKSVSEELGVSELTLKRFLYEYPYRSRLKIDRVEEVVSRMIKECIV